MTDRFTIEGDTLYFGRDDQRHGFNLGQLTDRSYNAVEILNLHADRIEQLEAALIEIAEMETGDYMSGPMRDIARKVVRSRKTEND